MGSINHRKCLICVFCLVLITNLLLPLERDIAPSWLMKSGRNDRFCLALSVKNFSSGSLLLLLWSSSKLQCAIVAKLYLIEISACIECVTVLSSLCQLNVDSSLDDYTLNNDCKSTCVSHTWFSVVALIEVAISSLFLFGWFFRLFWRDGEFTCWIIFRGRVIKVYLATALLNVRNELQSWLSVSISVSEWRSTL